MAPFRFLLVSTHTQQITTYSKVSYRLLKDICNIHPNIHVFHFGFQRDPTYISHTTPQLLTNVIQYDAAANENPKQQGFGFNIFKRYVRHINPDIIMIYNDPNVVNYFLHEIRDIEKTFKIWVYLDQVYKGVDMPLLCNIENAADKVLFTSSIICESPLK